MNQSKRNINFKNPEASFFGKLAVGLETSVTDPNNNTVHSYTSAMGKQTTIAAPENATTKFIYGPLGELIESIDPESISTTYEYDMLGQLTQREHPDAGVTNYEYDRSGNLLSVQTPNLGANKIEYDYHYNRLTQVNYPDNPENDVVYEYGNSGNETGRITKVKSNGNVKQFSYGNLGEITEEITTFVRPSGETYSFAMQTQYDSWNRILSMTYPDGEIVNYDYNLGGDLISVQGEKGGINYSYIEDIQYNKYGNQVFVQNGNGSYSNYTYDQTTLRLANLETYDGNSNKILDLDYTYDDASNITAIANSASQVNGLGGDFSYSYNYDDLYRLASSSGDFDNSNKEYNLEMSYSASGNILSKSLTANTQIGGLDVDIDRSYTYAYNQNQPHTINTVTNHGTDISFAWDENGNLTNYNDPDKGLTRNLCWDEENRLTTVKDNNYLSQYTYDAGGERVWKLTGEVSRMTINGKDYFDVADLNNATLYASPYLVVNRQEYTKHIYAGSKRIASKLAVGLESSLVDPIEYTVEMDIDYGELCEALQEYLDRSLSCTDIGAENVSRDMHLEVIDDLHHTPAEEVENDIYYYHTDHLGSSSWITYTDGSVTQHMQNLPFGEPFIDQRATSYDIRYKFTGKEMDSETGYQYFGARYYNSDISVWLSVDPMSDEYPSTSPYSYVEGNPIMFNDPTGMFKDWYKNENGEDVVHRDGHAESITVNGEKYENIGSTYTKEQSGYNYHYVQDKVVGITSTDKDFGSFLQNKSAYSAAMSVANQYSQKTVEEVYLKSFERGRHEMSMGSLKLMGAIISSVLAVETGVSIFLLAESVVAVGSATAARTGVQGSKSLGAAGKGFSKKGKFFRGGKKAIRDPFLNSKPKSFQRWFHRVYKDKGAPNMKKSGIDEAYKEWISRGKPNVK